MQFRMKNAPEWFCNVIYKHYIDELHDIHMQIKTTPNYTDLVFKEIALDYFSNKGFTVWLDQGNHLCFDLDPDNPKWFFEILRT